MANFEAIDSDKGYQVTFKLKDTLYFAVDLTPSQCYTCQTISNHGIGLDIKQNIALTNRRVIKYGFKIQKA
jgi:hypothetical protein